MLFDVQHGVLSVLSYVVFFFEAWALIDSLRYRRESFVAAEKQTKTFWTLLLGAAVTVGFLGLPATVGVWLAQPLSLAGLAAIVVAGIYLANVRPALRQHQPPGSAGGPRKNSTGGW